MNRFMKTTGTTMTIVYLFAITFLFAGCSGGGGSSSAPPAPALMTGVFVDSVVEGLNYRTATQIGVTDAAGIFQYREGETVTFSLGDTILGQTAAKEQITPVDLVAGASDETHPKVTNICRLLQSLDKDGIPENGIQIPQQIRDVLKNNPVDLSLGAVEFESGAAVKNLFSELNKLAVFTDKNERLLRTADQAQSHFRETMRSFPSGTGKPSLRTFATALELEAYLKQQYASRRLSIRTYTVDAGSPQPGNISTGGSLAGNTLQTAVSASAYSSTNIQEAGVDESDLVKTDGTYLYIAGNRKVLVVKAVPAEEMVKVSAIDLKGATGALHLYNKILAVFYTPDNGSVQYSFPIQTQQIGLMLIDVSNPANPQVKKDVVINGSFVSSRLIGGKLHVIQQFLPNLPALKLWYDGTAKDRADTVAANMKALSSLTLKDLMPGIQITDDQGKRTAPILLVAPANFYCSDESGSGSTVTVTTFDLNDPSYPWQSVGVAADASTVYATTGSLYLAAMRRNSTVGTLMPPVTTEETVIHKLDLTGDQVRPMGSGQVPGRLLNQYSLGEYESVLRIATTTGQVWGGPPTSANHVFCLKSGTEGLEVIGKLENLAPGEKIYAARFIGTRGFLVTFVKVDPLFTLDLSVPAAPRVVGVLKVPGYSDYLHPLDDNHLLAIGKDAKPEGGITWYQGVQLSLFDITDFANPKLLHKELLGVRATESEALSNPKAFTFWKERNLLAFPLHLYEYQKLPAAASVPGILTFIGLYGYRVSVEKGFELLGGIPSITNPVNLYPGTVVYYQTGLRGQFIGDWVYAVQSNSVSAARIDDMGGTVKRITIDN